MSRSNDRGMDEMQQRRREFRRLKKSYRWGWLFGTIGSNLPDGRKRSAAAAWFKRTVRWWP